MEILFLIFMILAITLSSLRITVIYLKWIIDRNLLYTVVLVVLLELAGTGVGGEIGLFPVTTNTSVLSNGLHVFSNLINDVTTIAEYVYNFILFNLTVFCEESSELPVAALPNILEFGGLHYTDAFKAMITALKGVAGVYAIIHTASGKAYIGSTQNIGLRVMSHLVYGSCNPHLQNALALYGLSAFVVRLVEEYILDPNLTDEENAARLLALEQRWLNWLFRLPPSLRYNFNPIANAPPSRLGEKHSLESRAKMTVAATGKCLSEETKAKMSAAKKGENHPNWGKIAHTAAAVSIYTLDGSLVKSFPSQSAAAEYLGVAHQTVAKALKYNFVVKRLYRVSSRS